MTTVIDLAGGANGGAGRFRAEFTRYALGRKLSATKPIGLGETVTLSWLMRREAIARGSHKTVAGNNVGFSVAGRERWTLLRNPNHFLSTEEWEGAAKFFSPTFALQTKVVRSMARRSDALVVPSSHMADRVSTILPGMTERVIIRHHPLAVPPRTRRESHADTILCPIVSSPHKRLAGHLETLRMAIRGRHIRVVCTMDIQEMPSDIRADGRFHFVGMVDRVVLDSLYEEAAVIYFPTSVESFGYPLAEGRAAGIPVVAQDIEHNREIAAGALFGYRDGDARSLSDALAAAFEADLSPDPSAFDPASYFDWLLS
jgi:glycosyltransferase involved in cell wall biosynthesis